MHWRLILRIVLTFWVWFYTPNVDRLHAEEPKPVRIIRLDPHTGLAPVYFRTTVWVEPHEGNRELCLVWGQEMVESSCRQLEGLSSPKAFHYPVNRTRLLIYSGQNVVAAVVTRNDGSVHVAKEFIEVRRPE